MLQVGQIAPAFTLKDRENKLISLSDFTGRKVVIYFYAKNNTPDCTSQACAFKEANSEFEKQNIVVMGISRDCVASHKNFAAKYELPFILLSDIESKAIKAYEVSTPMGAKRATYIIDELGVIESVMDEADPETNALEVLTYLKQ